MEGVPLNRPYLGLGLFLFSVHGVLSASSFGAIRS